MSRRNKKQSPEWEKLRLMSIKLRAIAFLIETQNSSDAPPDDIVEINWGLSMVLTDMSQSFRELSRTLEKQEIEQEPKGEDHG